MGKGKRYLLEDYLKKNINMLGIYTISNIDSRFSPLVLKKEEGRKRMKQNRTIYMNKARKSSLKSV